MAYSKNQVLALSFFIFAALLGMAVLGFGWFGDMASFRSILPGASTMKVNTALGLLGLAGSGLFYHFRFRSLKNSFASKAFALFSVLISAFTLIEHFTGMDFQIDEFFIRDEGSLGSRWHPGRPSPVTSICILLIGIAMSVQSRARSRLTRLAQGSVLIALLISFQAITCYIEGINTSYGSAVFTQLALPTAFTLALLCIGFLFSHPNELFIRVLTSPSEAGKTARRFTAFAIFLPPSISWLQKFGQERLWWDQEFALMLQVIANVVVWTWLALKTGAALLQAEEKNELFQNELLKSIQGRDEFLSIASHELRTPLTTLTIHYEIIKRKIDKNDLTPARLLIFIESIESGIKHINRLVGDMLDISRIQNGSLKLEIKPTELVNVVKEVTERYHDNLTDAHILLTLQPMDEVVLNLDRFRIEQVLANLLTNAIRYAPNSTLEFSLKQDETSATLYVEDGGRGIEPKDREKIFQRYERLVSEKTVGGLGLGLYIVRQIIEEHGGTVQVEGDPGKGACFVIRFKKNFSK